MSVSGSPSSWLDLLETMLPELLQLVVDTWQVLPRPLVDDKEDAITNVLCSALRKNRTQRELPFRVDVQWVEINPGPQQKKGRLDIAFHPTSLPDPPDEEIYFCLECKRLNYGKGKKRQWGGSEYVKNGMMRFVNKQYAKSVRYGGMLGYVLHSDVSGAIKNVEANVSRNYSALCMDAPGLLHPSSILASVPSARESFHHRQDETSLFCIFHLFMKADGFFEENTTEPF